MFETVRREDRGREKIEYKPLPPLGHKLHNAKLLWSMHHHMRVQIEPFNIRKTPFLFQLDFCLIKPLRVLFHSFFPMDPEQQSKFAIHEAAREGRSTPGFLL